MRIALTYHLDCQYPIQKLKTILTNNLEKKCFLGQKKKKRKVKTRSNYDHHFLCWTYEKYRESCGIASGCGHNFWQKYLHNIIAISVLCLWVGVCIYWKINHENVHILLLIEYHLFFLPVGYLVVFILFA